MAFQFSLSGHLTWRNGQDYKPQTLISDCADAITNAARIVFGNIKRIHCWAHVIRNVDKHLFRIKCKATRQLVREDILQLQLAKSEEEFFTASGLWVKK